MDGSGGGGGAAATKEEKAPPTPPSAGGAEPEGNGKSKLLPATATAAKVAASSGDGSGGGAAAAGAGDGAAAASDEGGALVECVVCMGDASDGAVFEGAPELWCGHTACLQCWKEYLVRQVQAGKSKAECLGMATDGTGCNAAVGHSVIEKVMDKDLRERYTHLLHEAMVMASKSMVWCPTPDCKTAVKAESAVATLGSVECKTCKNQFCFECGVEHAPAHCAHMRAFEKKCAKEGGNIDWLVKNTRECPKCASFIEKAGGCNWIKCGRCTFEFCWLCGRAMKHSEAGENPRRSTTPPVRGGTKRPRPSPRGMGGAKLLTSALLLRREPAAARPGLASISADVHTPNHDDVVHSKGGCSGRQPQVQCV